METLRVLFEETTRAEKNLIFDFKVKLYKIFNYQMVEKLKKEVDIEYEWRERNV
jgi:hypothetical protein